MQLYLDSCVLIYALDGAAAARALRQCRLDDQRSGANGMPGGSTALLTQTDLNPRLSITQMIHHPTPGC